MAEGVDIMTYKTAIAPHNDTMSGSNIGPSIGSSSCPGDQIWCHREATDLKLHRNSNNQYLPQIERRRGIPLLLEMDTQTAHVQEKMFAKETEGANTCR